MSDDLMQVASFSGGRTSAYMCVRLLEIYPRERLRFVFMDTGAEHPRTYDFIQQVDEHLGLELVCLRCDADTPMGAGNTPRSVSSADVGPDLVPFASIANKYGTPSVVTPWCTSRLKADTARKWCAAQFGRWGFVTWIGVRGDEPKRLGGVGKSPYMRYLAEIDDADKQDVFDFWDDMPFDLQLPVWLGNCVFCVKKSDAKVALAVRQEPEMAERWSAMLRDGLDRLKTNGRTSENVYRKHRTLREVCAMYADVPTDRLIASIRSARKEPGTCTESCEPFIEDPRQTAFPWYSP